MHSEFEEILIEEELTENHHVKTGTFLMRFQKCIFVFGTEGEKAKSSFYFWRETL